jgi:hypothetical protein
MTKMMNSEYPLRRRIIEEYDVPDDHGDLSDPDVGD